MKRHVIVVVVLIVYNALLVKVMVFKSIPIIKVGQLMLNFGGVEAGHAPNFVPFATIGPYLLGYKGWIIAGINLAGNIVLLVPLGLLVPMVFPRLSWQKSLILAAVSGLAIETTQVVLRVGIFDIDDVILNALGFMIGYFAYFMLSKWFREGKYLTIVVAAVLIAASAFGAVYAVYPHGQPVRPTTGAGDFNGEESVSSQGDDLCGGTGGVGQIATLASNSFVLTRKDGTPLQVALTDRAAIYTPAGVSTVSDLHIGDKVTLVGGPNADASFTAEAVYVCSGSGSELSH